MSSERGRTKAVPAGRLARFGSLARLATGIAGGMLSEGSRRLAQGELPRARDLLLTPANARRVAGELANLRGAAMKLGQLLSMDAGELLPPALAEILARLRADARSMPRAQLEAQLVQAWGRQWQKRLRSFEWQPVAAASIGQVHRATGKGGRELAIKIQYPGIARSIDADVDNVAALLRVTRLLPKELVIGPLLEEAKRQLHEEADYLREAGHLARFGELLAGNDDFLVPGVDEALTRPEVLVMDFVDSEPVEGLADAAQAVRDRVIGLLFELLFREMFEFRLVQTDPNFANFRWQPAAGRLVLLDFGATRPYTQRMIAGYRKLFKGALAGDRERLRAGAEAIGYFPDPVQPRHREAVLDLFVLATEPFTRPGRYDFRTSDLPARLREAGMALSFGEGYWHNPPAAAVFLHRKLGGLYLLGQRLGAQVDLRSILEERL